MSKRDSGASSSSSAKKSPLRASSTACKSPPQASGEDDLDARVATARQNLQSMMGDLKQTREGVRTAQERGKNMGTASAELDAKWKAFQTQFDDMNRRLIGAIGGSLQQESGIVLPIAPSSNKDTKDDWWRQYSEEERQEVFEGAEPNLPDLCRFIKTGKIQKIVVMCGAGISVSAGIPDFRSKGGLYEKLRREHGMSRPETLFDISYFRKNPRPFAERSLEMLPGKFQPTLTHFFLSLLMQKGLLQRVYTQNIDTLEKLAGLPDEMVVYAHGSFADVHCIECRRQVRLDDWRAKIEKHEIPRCLGPPQRPRRGSKASSSSSKRDHSDEEDHVDSSLSPSPKDERGEKIYVHDGVDRRQYCAGLVKPDIVFFGENLPPRFGAMRRKDFEAADALIVMGTSLKVSPFNTCITLPLKNGGRGVRVLVNNEAVGTAEEQPLLGPRAFQFSHPKNFRDLFLEGACDEQVLEMCHELGWTDELKALQKSCSSQDGNGWKTMVDHQASGEGLEFKIRE
ncbi:unnamed protein product [Amoebophrya sp. A25]|nr:unnamed protein product [Amoebophrya sp. A25]|eukprot:GSA25T00016036001.1